MISSHISGFRNHILYKREWIQRTSYTKPVPRSILINGLMGISSLMFFRNFWLNTSNIKLTILDPYGYSLPVNCCSSIPSLKKWHHLLLKTESRSYLQFFLFHYLYVKIQQVLTILPCRLDSHYVKGYAPLKVWSHCYWSDIVLLFLMEAFTAPSSFLYLREWKPEQQETHCFRWPWVGWGREWARQKAWNKKIRVFKFEIFGCDYFPMRQTGIS